MVRVAGLALQFPGARVEASGSVVVRGTVLDLPYTATIGDLGAFAACFGIPGPLGGSGTASGRATGPLATSSLSASGTLRGARFLDMQGETARIGEFVAEFGGGPTRVHMTVDASGVMFAGQHAPFASATLQTVGTIADAAFRVHGVHADTLITGRAHADGGITTVDIDTARVVLAGETWQVADAPLRFVTRGGITSFLPWRVVAARGGELRAAELVFGPADRVHGSFVLTDVPVATPRRDGDSPYWRGRLGGEIRLAGATANPDARVHLSAHTDSASADIAVTEGSLWCDIAGRVARLDSLWLRAGDGGDLRAAGVFSYAPGVPESLMAQQWSALHAVSCDAHVWTNRLDLGAWTRGVRQLTVPVGGQLVADMTVRGTLARPDLAWRARAAGFSAREFVSDSLIADGRWQNGGALPAGVTLDSVVVHRSGERAVLRGVVPAWLDIPRGLTVGSAGLDIAADLPAFDMTALPALVPVLGDAAGTMSGNVALRGDPHAPTATGALHVRDGQLRGFGREEVISHIAGDVAINGHGLEITSLSGDAGEGRVSLAGRMSWARGEPTRYDFRTDVRNFWISQPGMFNGHVSGILHLVRDADAPTMFTPKLIGAAHVDDARIVWEFNQNTGTDPALIGVYQVPTPAMTFDVHLTGERNILLANRDANIEMQVDVQTSLTYAGIPAIVGTLKLTRGYYRFFDTRFSGVEGTVTFSAGEINPALAIKAEAKIRDKNRQPSTVQLTLGGKQLTPEVGLEAPGMSREEIVKALSYGKLTSISQDASGKSAAAQYTQNVTDVGTNVLIRQLERSVLRDTGLLDVFDVDYTSGQSRISVGKYLANELFVNYQQGLSTSESDVSIEYWLTNRILLHGQYTRTSQDATSTSSTTTQNGAVRVGLKARKEF